MEKYADMIVKQWKVLAGVVGTVLALLVFVGVWKDAQARHEREATNMLYDAQLGARKAASEKKPEEAEKAFQPLFGKFPSSRAAFEARLQLGDVWMDAGNSDKAAEQYKAAVDGASDSFSKLLALYTYGVAKETGGKIQEAVGLYEEALKSPGSDFLRPEILMAQARCFEALQQPAKAIELYKTVQEKFSTRSYYSGAAAAFEKQLQTKKM